MNFPSKKLVLLDLEETLIDDWSTKNVIVSDSLNDFLLKETQGATVGLLSWAVCNAQDVEHFNKKLRKDLEIQFGLVFDNDFLLLLDDHLIPLFAKWFMVPSFNSDDMTCFFKKDNVMFEIWKRMFHEFDEIVFLDDTVHDIEMNSNGRKLRLVNAKRIINGG